MSKSKFGMKSFIIPTVLSLALVVGLYAVNKPTKEIVTSEAAPKKSSTTNPLVDVDRNGVVNTADLDVFQNIYGIINNGGWSYIFWAVDINHDGQVNIQDAAIIGNANGSTVTACLWADADGNGVVTNADLDIFSQNLGQINKDTNRYDINNDSQVNIQDIVIAQKELKNKCR